jgi:hypothetical protein
MCCQSLHNGDAAVDAAVDGGTHMAQISLKGKGVKPILISLKVAPTLYATAHHAHSTAHHTHGTAHHGTPRHGTPRHTTARHGTPRHGNTTACISQPVTHGVVDGTHCDTSAAARWIGYNTSTVVQPCIAHCTNCTPHELHMVKIDENYMTWQDLKEHFHKKEVTATLQCG